MYMFLMSLYEILCSLPHYIKKFNTTLCKAVRFGATFKIIFFPFLNLFILICAIIIPIVALISIIKLCYEKIFLITLNNILQNPLIVGIKEF